MRVVVYSWENHRQSKLSSRKGTAEAIDLADGVRLEETAEEVDASCLDDDGFVEADESAD